MELIAATIPILNRNPAILEGGQECSLYSDQDLTPIDTVWATMAMVKDYSAQIEALKNADNISSVEISEQLAEYIRRIIVVLQQPPENFEAATEKNVLKKYVLHLESDGTNKHGAKEIPAPKCAVTVLSFPYRKNGYFFWKLYRGLEIASELLRDNVANREEKKHGKEFDRIIARLGKHKLRTPDEQYKEEGFEILRKWLDGEEPEEETMTLKCGTE